MHPIVGLGFGTFFIVALVAGLRLVRLSLRTRRLPEFLIGSSILGIGPVGFGLAVIAQLVADATQRPQPGLFAIAMLAVAAGAFAKFVFIRRVYHPESRMCAALVVSGGLALLAAWGSDLATGGFVNPYATTPSFLVRSLVQTACLLWGALEALHYWIMMRRRRTLGLSDPEVTNRFFLWGLAAWMAGQGTLVGVVVQIVTGASSLEIPWVMVSSSFHGLVAATSMWLAFVPPGWYRRWIGSRAAGTVS